jgi:hypothetical protein
VYELEGAGGRSKPRARCAETLARSDQKRRTYALAGRKQTPTYRFMQRGRRDAGGGRKRVEFFINKARTLDEEDARPMRVMNRRRRTLRMKRAAGFSRAVRLSRAVICI